jgi:hypothetical protein
LTLAKVLLKVSQTTLVSMSRHDVPPQMGYHKTAYQSYTNLGQQVAEGGIINNFNNPYIQANPLGMVYRLIQITIFSDLEINQRNSRNTVLTVPHSTLPHALNLLDVPSPQGLGFFDL